MNDADRDRSVVRNDLLEDLNRIFHPDSSFLDIQSRRVPSTDNTWEIYLQEADKGEVALSKSGSGLKTVLLVLSFLHLVPRTPGMETDLSKWVFAFEELENNLHPALQRRLYEYLHERVRNDGITLFLTTHSPVVIDLFAGDDDAQILHITNDGTEARVKRVFQYDEHCGILDDLDVRASDILQANGIIWVEGPSDRLYMNRWIHLWSNGELQEGLHYQCVFYGGRLLSHLSADDPDEASDREAIEILRVNRNAIFLIDSDRKSADQGINATKTRIVAEVEAMSGLAWVTQGREVEHYLPASAFSEAVW